jgi:hypothetical protein
LKRQAIISSPRDRLFFFGAAAERDRVRELGRILSESENNRIW